MIYDKFPAQKFGAGQFLLIEGQRLRQMRKGSNRHIGSFRPRARLREVSLPGRLGKAREIAIGVHHENFPAPRQDLPLSIPLSCGLDEKGVAAFLQSKTVFRSSKFNAKFQDVGVKGEALLKLSNAQFWDQGIEAHRVCCSLIRNGFKSNALSLLIAP